MPTISNASVSVGSTAIAATGGASEAFTSLGDSLDRNEIVFDKTSNVDKKTASFTVTRSKPNASSPDGFTQDRRSVTLRYPILLADGVTWKVNTVKIDFSSSVETSTADLTDMRFIAAQLLSDSDFDNYYEALSVS